MKILAPNSEDLKEAYSKAVAIIDNEKKLPEYIFSKKYIFNTIVNFNEIFEINFIKEIIDKSNTKKLFIISLNPEAIYYDIQGYLIAPVTDEEVIMSLETEFKAEKYLEGIDINYYTIVDEFIIFGDEISIYANREYEVAIIASQFYLNIDSKFILKKEEYNKIVKNIYYNSVDAKNFSYLLFKNFNI